LQTARDDKDVRILNIYNSFTPCCGGRPGLRFGAKIPACAVCTPTNETGSASSNRRVRAEECHHVFLHIGIVDIFQNYNVIKRIEHAYKSIIQYDSTLVSTVNPKLYSSRLHHFLSKLFSPEDSD
jgi:hypothetical protein